MIMPYEVSVADLIESFTACAAPAEASVSLLVTTLLVNRRWLAEK